MTEPMKPHFQGRPTYPVTVIPLPHGRLLRHLPTESFNAADEGLPEPLGEGVPSHSRYRIEVAEGLVLLEFRSMLSLPSSKDGEFEAYYRENDEITVFVSTSGNTILLVEDRSPTFPNAVFHLIRFQNGQARWTLMEVEAQLPSPAVGQTEGMSFRGPLSLSYPKVAGLTDESVIWTLDQRSWQERLPQ